MLLIYPAGVSNGYIKFEKNIKNFEIPEKIYLYSAIVHTAIVNACTISSRLILGVIIPELSEPPVRTLGATIPENESHIFR